MPLRQKREIEPYGGPKLKYSMAANTIGVIAILRSNFPIRGKSKEESLVHQETVPASWRLYFAGLENS